MQRSPLRFWLREEAELLSSVPSTVRETPILGPHRDRRNQLQIHLFPPRQKTVGVQHIHLSKKNIRFARNEI